MEILLHSVEEARRLIGLGRTRFYQEVLAGNITIVKSGKKSLVPTASLQAYVAAKIREAQGPT